MVRALAGPGREQVKLLVGKPEALDDARARFDGVDGVEDGGLDCNDADALISPFATELWYDGVDQDCAADDDFDADGDGFGDPRYPVATCPVGQALSNLSLNDRDCDDADRARNPSLGTCP